MLDVLIRAGCFIAIIVLGYVLRRIGLFKGDAFGMLSQIVLKLTLPASIVLSFASMEMEVSMLTLALLGFGGGILYLLAAYLINLKKTKSQQAFEMLNLPGYNIGIFTMPFVQNFLGPVGVVTASIFDVGNAFVCLGGSYGVASAIKEGKGLSFKRIVKALGTSVPFLVYLVMILVSLFRIPLPGPFLSFAEIIKNANAFLAMLMIGVGFKLNADKAYIGTIVKLVSIRYGIAVLVALAFYYLLPFDLEIRQTLVIMAFSPIGSAVPAFTAELKEDVGLSSAINSICIVISIVIIVALLSVMMV